MHRLDLNLEFLPARLGVRLPGLSYNQLLQAAASSVQLQFLQQSIS